MKWEFETRVEEGLVEEVEDGHCEGKVISLWVVGQERVVTSVVCSADVFE